MHNDSVIFFGFCTIVVHLLYVCGKIACDGGFGYGNVIPLWAFGLNY